MNFELLKRLTQATAVSGNEAAVRDILLKEITPYASSIQVTALGNIIAEKKGNKRPEKKCMISAHMDEVGMTVTEISKGGALFFDTVGGIDSAVLLGKSVFVNGNIPGVIGGKPVHLMSGDEFAKVIPAEKLSIDIGAATKEEALAHVSIGDTVSFPPYFEMERGTIKGKALDDRVGCFLLVELIKTELAYDTTFVFTVQEEVGCRGAQTAANVVLPDIAVAVEGTVAGDVMDIKGAKVVTQMGKGPAVSIVDRGTVYDREYFKLAFEISQEKGVNCQARTGSAGKNDASAMHKAGAGARAIAVSVPCRYIHCPISLCSVQDTEDAFVLLTELLVRLHD